MLKLKKVALTGGLSSGKSTVLAIFQRLGATVVNADEFIHHLLSSNVTVIHRVLEILGEEVLDRGRINRKAIANKVFNNSEKLKQLEFLLHPPLRQEIHRIYDETLQQTKHGLFVVEIPLFFEKGGDSWYDSSLCIDSDEEHCIERFKRKTGLTEEDYRRRMRSQLSLGEKKAKADEIINNNCSLEELENQVRHYYLSHH